nr:MAG TPA: hypothetical protein [Caudoviricetes sp.]
MQHNLILGHMDFVSFPKWEADYSHYVNLQEVFYDTANDTGVKGSGGIQSLNYILDILQEFNIPIGMDPVQLIDSLVLEFAFRTANTGNKIDVVIVKTFISYLIGYLQGLGIIKFGITRKIFFKQEISPDLTPRQLMVIANTLYTVYTKE